MPSLPRRHLAGGLQLDERLASLDGTLRATDPATLVSVAVGKVLRLGDYLVTRIVEQVVHPDDLDRSLGWAPCSYPAPGRALCVDLGVAMASARSGAAGVVRALFRAGGADDVLPVL